MEDHEDGKLLIIYSEQTFRMELQIYAQRISIKLQNSQKPESMQ